MVRDSRPLLTSFLSNSSRFADVELASAERSLTMKFETLRLMAQDYADRHKEPPPLPATIDTMTYAYQRICQGEDPWTALGDFSNTCYGYAKHIRPALVKA